MWYDVCWILQHLSKTQQPVRAIKSYSYQHFACIMEKPSMWVLVPLVEFNHWKIQMNYHRTEFCGDIFHPSVCYWINLTVKLQSLLSATNPSIRSLYLGKNRIPMSSSFKKRTSTTFWEMYIKSSTFQMSGVWLVCGLVCLWCQSGVVCNWYTTGLKLGCRWCVAGVQLVCFWYATGMWDAWATFVQLVCDWCAKQKNNISYWFFQEHM